MANFDGKSLDRIVNGQEELSDRWRNTGRTLKEEGGRIFTALTFIGGVTIVVKTALLLFFKGRGSDRRDDRRNDNWRR